MIKEGRTLRNATWLEARIGAGTNRVSHHANLVEAMAEEHGRCFHVLSHALRVFPARTQALSKTRGSSVA